MGLMIYKIMHYEYIMDMDIMDKLKYSDEQEACRWERRGNRKGCGVLVYQTKINVEPVLTLIVQL